MISKMKELFRWRQLILGLAVKDLKVKYRQATGGFGWMLVMPLVQMAIFTFVFKFLFKIKIEKYPLFLLSGLISWGFLRSSLDGAANSIINNANLIKKTYFPREILPISNVITNLVTFLFSLVTLSVFSLFFKIPLSPAIFWLPLVVLTQIILIIGISLFFASLNTIYRDARFIMDIILLLWFYVTPIVYSPEMARKALSPHLFLFYRLNPIIGIISAYQNIFAWGNAPDIGLLLLSVLASIIFLILGFINFRRHEEAFVDVI